MDVNVSSFVLFGATFFLSFVIFQKLKHKSGPSEDRLRPSCLPSLPVVGSLLFLPWYDIKAVPGHLMKLAEKYGSIFAFYAGPAYIVSLNGKEAFEAGYLKQSTNFADRNGFYQERCQANPKLKGLSFLNFNKEFKFNHTLSLSILKEFGFGNNSLMQSRILVELERLVDEIRHKKGQAFDPLPLSEACVSSVIVGMMFDHQFDFSDSTLLNLAKYSRESVENMSIVLELFPVVRHIPYFKRGLTKYVEVNKDMLALLKIEIANVWKRSSGNSFVEKYVDRIGKEYDAEQLEYLVRDLVLAGTDTVATMLRWALVMLADHPHIQDWLREEIDSVIPGGRFPKMEDEPNLPRVRAAILELLRWKTLIPSPLPRRTLWDTKVHGLFIPAGSTVVGNIYSVNMDPEVWPEPKVYRPERFLDKNGQVFGGDRIVPFSLGRRSCFGEVLARQELFIFFTGIVQQFKVLPPDGRTSVGTCERYGGATIAPAPFQIRMLPRE